MELELNRKLSRERLEVRRRRQLRDERVRIDQIRLLPQHPWAQIQIKATLEVLANQIFVQRDFSQRVDLLR